MAVLILFTEPIRFLAGNSYAAASSPRRRKIMQRSTLPELPRLESVLAKNVPVHVQHRLRFEWAQIEQSASHGATALCHSFSREFMTLVRGYGITVGEEISRRFCAKCDCVQLPTVTCTVRVSHNSKQAGKKRPRCRNQVVVRCNMCGQTSRHQGTRLKRAPSVSKKQTEAVAAPAPAPQPQPVAKKPFSFSGDFIALGPKQPGAPAKPTGFATLDELEAARKKKRKKSSESLANVKQLFQAK